MTPIKGGAVLFSEMTPRPGNEDVFNAWYDNHHMPHHVKGVPGFLSGQRYKSAAGPHYLAVYELESSGALETEEYKTRKFTPDAGTKAVLDSVTGFTRYIGTEEHCRGRPGFETSGINGNVILAVFFAVPFDRAPDFNAWYDGEHIPMLLECEDWLMGRRFTVEQADPERYSHMMLHYLNDAAAIDSEAVARSRETEARKAFAEESWYEPHMVFYERRRERVLKDD